ncbi:SCO1664 family protein [Litorihabitans aurantiacus]|uniref:Phosphatidylinositol kinase n=1 Tax=Litorihabitans aurantiacus TaxID=1930061 RepID=A0AA37XDQ3_9MICO|nr:SCO1664 family protein [Litorihabitans aurantiacus]GMA30557.1 phosphatidylinositol kinase [Litorihabitans aurantiacus]
MADADLPTGELTLTGRIRSASNATFLGAIGGTAVVYKPIDGEAPLWDFPDGALAHREVAAHLVSEALEWGVVPPTWLREGPFGTGMVQVWQEQDAQVRAVDLLPSDEVPEVGWRPVLQGRDAGGRLVTLVHEDSAALRRMAVFDVVVNNADRKGDHVLAMPDGHRHGVDHGLTFHREHKLRTVLWGWLGEELTQEERDGVRRLLESVQGGLGRELAELLEAEEIEALAARCSALLKAACFPAPAGDASAVPWPLF